MGDTDELFPEMSQLCEPLPRALRTGDGGLHEVPGKYHEALQEMRLGVRRVACLLYLAHTGKLKDSEGRIKFTLTPAELDAWHEATVGERQGPNQLKASIEALKEQGLAGFYHQRECRKEGEPSPAFRFERHVFPVTAEDV
jgi:hypothetical protein